MSDELPPLNPNLPKDILLAPLRTTGTAPTGAFLIDPDQAEAFIHKIDQAALDLDDALRAAREAGRFPAMNGADPMTTNAVEQARKMAQNAENFARAYQRQLRETATGLRDQLAAYRAADQANTARPT